MPNFVDELKSFVEQQENCGAVLDTHGLQKISGEDGERFDRHVYSFILNNHPNGAKRIFARQQEASVGEKKAVYKTVLAGPHVRDGGEAVLYVLDQLRRSLRRQSYDP